MAAGGAGAGLSANHGPSVAIGVSVIRAPNDASGLLLCRPGSLLTALFGRRFLFLDLDHPRPRPPQ